MRSLWLLIPLMAFLVLSTFLNTVQSTPVLLEKLLGYNGYSNSGYGAYGYNYNRGYGGYGSYGGGYPAANSGTQNTRNRASGGRSYKDICRVITGDAYANPGKSPFPAQPFCPY